MLVVGIDVGSKNCGITVMQVQNGISAVLEACTIELCSFKSFDPMLSGQRINSKLNKLLSKYTIDYFAVERQPVVGLRQRGSIKATVVNCAIEAQILALVAANQVDVVRVAPQTWRKKWGIKKTKTFKWYSQQYTTTQLFSNICEFDLATDVHQIDAALIAINNFI